MIIKSACLVLCVVGLSACATSDGQDTPSPVVQAETNPLENYKPMGYKEISYKASGKTYTLFVLQKGKGNFGLDKVNTYVSKGTPFTATSADDAEVQNLVRDAYRAFKLCPAGTHPGIVNFGYGPFMLNDLPMWNVYLRCTKKLQSNI